MPPHIPKDPSPPFMPIYMPKFVLDFAATLLATAPPSVQEAAMQWQLHGALASHDHRQTLEEHLVCIWRIVTSDYYNHTHGREPKEKKDA